MRPSQFTLSVAAVAALTSSAFAGPIVYDFADGDPFDFVTGGGAGTVGATSTQSDGTTSVALTTADVQCPQYGATTPFAATGVMLSAAGRTGFTTADVRTQTLTAVSATQMGINNPSIADSNGTTAGIGGNESGNFNQNEAWVFRFNSEVTFTQMNLTSIDADDVVTITVATPTPLTFTLVDGATNDDYNDPLAGLVIPANTEITFKNTSAALNAIERIDSFTVTPTPEPAALAVIGLAGIAIGRRRRA